MLHNYYQKHFRMNQDAVTPAISDKKRVRKEIGEKLAGALAEYKQELGDKKLATHVKKISKLISRDLLKISKKKQRTSKKASAKTIKTRKKTEKKAVGQ